MSAENPDSLTLTERLSKAQYLARELSEHLTQAYLPKLNALKAASREFDEKKVSDQQVFDRTKAVLDAEDFAENIHSQLDAYMRSIRREMRQLLDDGHGSREIPKQP